MSSTTVILRTGVFRRWLGWSGAFAGLAAIAGSGAIVENDPTGIFAAINGFAWLAFFLWSAALSIALIRTPEAPGNA